MADVPHGELSPENESGIHVALRWPIFATEEDMQAQDVSEEDVSGHAFVLATRELWYLANHSPKAFKLLPDGRGGVDLIRFETRDPTEEDDDSSNGVAPDDADNIFIGKHWWNESAEREWVCRKSSGPAEWERVARRIEYPATTYSSTRDLLATDDRGYVPFYDTLLSILRIQLEEDAGYVRGHETKVVQAGTGAVEIQHVSGLGNIDYDRSYYATQALCTRSKDAVVTLVYQGNDRWRAFGDIEENYILAATNLGNGAGWSTANPGGFAGHTGGFWTLTAQRFGTLTARTIYAFERYNTANGFSGWTKSFIDGTNGLPDIRASVGDGAVKGTFFNAAFTAGPGNIVFDLLNCTGNGGVVQHYLQWGKLVVNSSAIGTYAPFSGPTNLCVRSTLSAEYALIGAMGGIKAGGLTGLQVRDLMTSCKNSGVGLADTLAAPASNLWFANTIGKLVDQRSSAHSDDDMNLVGLGHTMTKIYTRGAYGF